MRARGGTRTGLRALQTLGARGNMRNSTRSGGGTAESAAQGVHNVHTLFCPLRCPIPPTRAPGWAREFSNSRLDGIDDEGCWLSLSMFPSGILMAIERFLKCCTCSTDALYERVCVGVVFRGLSSRAIRSGSPPSGPHRSAGMPPGHDRAHRPLRLGSARAPAAASTIHRHSRSGQ
jgi:hypothetical protein